MEKPTLQVEKALRQLRLIIRELEETQRELVSRKRPKNPHVAKKLSYAFAVREFLLTGSNNHHKGRLHSWSRYKTADATDPSINPYMLVEETNNPGVATFCRSLASLMTYDQYKVFFFSEDRRYNNQNGGTTHAAIP